MKILTLNHEFPPVGGGASPVSFELCRHLVQLGHQVDVVTMGFGGLPGREVVDGVVVYRTPALRKRADICHTHEMATYLPGALPRALGLARRN
ncbi:MAG: glycosyltransferase, partial [Sedimentisphaerales bacterium]|nr:glycosyltransferase [Sedimentisphaerales bacterium]